MLDPRLPSSRFQSNAVGGDDSPGVILPAPLGPAIIVKVDDAIMLFLFQDP